MARRTHNHLDDDDTSSDDGHEFELENVASGSDGPRKRMRRTKEDAIYGIFGDDEGENEPDGGAGRTVRARDVRGRKVDYRAGQAFVPASTSKPVVVQDKDTVTTPEGQSSRSTYRQDANQEEEEENDFRPASFTSSRRGIGSTSVREPRPFTSRAGIGARPGIGSDIDYSEVQGQQGEPESDSKSAPFDNSREGVESTPREPREPRPKPKGRTGIGSRAGIGTTSSGDADSDPSFRRSGLTSLSMFVSAGASKPHPTTMHDDAPDAAPIESASIPPSRAPSSDLHPTSDAEGEALAAVGLPTTFSKPPVASSSFQRPSKPTPTAPATNIKFGGKFDPSAYLASMGWTGGGLGKSGQGIVAPIEVQLRPERAGIAYGGLKEKTKQARDEARRRGEPVSSDEEETSLRRKQQNLKAKEKKEKPAWKEPKPRKPKIEHRTYEQIIEEIGALPAMQSTLGKIYDASGGEMREVKDLATALGRRGVPSATEAELPELQHNLNLICDNNAQMLTTLAREGVQIQDRKRWLRREAEMAARKRALEERKLVRIKGILQLVKRLEEVSLRVTALVKEDEEGEEVLSEFTPLLDQLAEEYGDELVPLALDEAVVGALAPILSILWSRWKPLKQPTLTTAPLRTFQRLLPTQDTSSSASSSTMTPYATLLWTLWLPCIRTAINEWKPHHPSSAVTLLEAWRPLVPRFIFDNIVDQLLLPRLRNSIASWEPRTSWGLEHVLFPWLPLLGLAQMHDVLTEAKTRLRAGLKVCSISQGPSAGLAQWRKFYTSNKDGGGEEWEALLLSTVVPRLASHLKSRLTISAREENQDLKGLQEVLKWKSVLGRRVIARVVAMDFFPKWLGVMCELLKQPLGEVGGLVGWYEYWRMWWVREGLVGRDEERGDDLGNVGFCTGLNFINYALDRLSARSSLEPPAFAPGPTKTAVTIDREERDRGKEHATFRDILEAQLAHHDLFLFKTSRVHATGPVTTATVWRVSTTTLSTKRAAMIHLDDDVVYQEVQHEWLPVSIQSLIQSLT